MARCSKLTKTVCDASRPGVTRYTVWDSTLSGFGLAVAPTGRKTFVLRYRPRSGGGAAPKRFINIGRFGPITADQARDSAMKLLGLVAGGDDPAAAVGQGQTISVAEAAATFMRDHVAKRRKPSTVSYYDTVLKLHVLPAFGRHRLDRLNRADVAKLHSRLAATPFMANRVLAVIGALYGWSGRMGLTPEGYNPTKGLEKFREPPRQRFLTSTELERLGKVLREAETVGIPWTVNESKPTVKHVAKPANRFTRLDPTAVAAIRLLLLTGCRLREILTLRWDEIDFDQATLSLRDSKTGPKTVICGDPAMAVLRGLPQVGPFVFPGATEDRPMTGLKRPWTAVTGRAGLPGLRLHDLRHTYASVAAGAGLGLPLIGAMLGHSQPRTTARYAHLAGEVLREAAQTVTAHLKVFVPAKPGNEAK